MIPNQIGLERADYSAIADHDSVHPSYGTPDFRKVLESVIAWLMLLYDDFFCWLPTVQVPKNCALLHGCLKSK